MLRTANTKDFKNVTFDALSFFFFFLMQLDERVLSSCDVVGFVKNTLSLCVRSTAFATLAAPPIKDPSAPNIGRNGNAPPRFAVGSIRFFVVFFFVVVVVFFFFGFMPIPILVLAFIAAQTAAAAALSPRAESLAVMRFRAFSARAADLCPRHLWLIASQVECLGRKTGSRNM
ncbi:hypothetical protein ALC56_03138 [Trachymyrmex septentrionalis]|uniref:Uncharacterized protein n=1 Tax=Trachymyrmex septentrionalis TaxID=34720 RepID=A0A151JZX0_9HYME|nr:hypothetical protein ALC56_03138 [Trachymyrmex septentrionalis]